MPTDYDLEKNRGQRTGTSSNFKCPKPECSLTFKYFLCCSMLTLLFGSALGVLSWQFNLFQNKHQITVGTVTYIHGVNFDVCGGRYNCGTDCQVRIEYVFEVGDVFYSNSDRLIFGSCDRKLQNAKDYIKSHPPNSTVDIYYLKTDPNQSQTKKGYKDDRQGDFAGYVIGFLIFVGTTFVTAIFTVICCLDLFGKEKIMNGK